MIRFALNILKSVQSNLIVIVLFSILLASCKTIVNEGGDVGIPKKSKIIDLKGIIDSNYTSVVEVIHSSECFKCKPGFMQQTAMLDTLNLPKSNKLFVFTEIREIEKEKFLRENLGIVKDSNQFTIIFNNQLFNQLHDDYCNTCNSFILTLKPMFESYSIGLYYK